MIKVRTNNLETTNFFQIETLIFITIFNASKTCSNINIPSKN